MLDLVRVFAWLLAMLRSIRKGSGLCIACGLLAGYASTVAALNIARAIRAGSIPGDHALGLVFLGTGFAAGEVIPGLPLSAMEAMHPRARLLFTAGLCGSSALFAWKRSSRLRPETTQARSWDAIGSSFLLLAVMDLILFAAAAFMDWAVTTTALLQV